MSSSTTTKEVSDLASLDWRKAVHLCNYAFTSHVNRGCS